MKATNYTAASFFGKVKLLGALAILACASMLQVQAQVPGILSFQGRITVNNSPFSGTGQFKFALVNAAGTNTFWSNDGTSGEPAASVSLPVSGGLYSVLLGDTSIPGMTQSIPARIFAENSDVRVRVWFNDGTNGSQLLTPDQRIASVGYALNAPVGVPRGAQEYKTPGTYTFTVPAGVSTILVEVWGAGGGYATTSGGAGAYSRKSFKVKAGDQWSVVVGAAGVNGSPTPPATAGQTSSVTSVTVPGSTLVSQGGPAGTGTPGVFPTPALPDASADVGREGPVWTIASSASLIYVTGSVAPPSSLTAPVPPSTVPALVFASAAGYSAGFVPTPPGPGYVLIQW